MELNAEQTKQALECCSVAERHSCYYCSYHKQAYCRERLSQNTLALILAYEEQIQKLTEENERLRAEDRKLNIITENTDVALYAYQHLFDIRADTVREMVRRLGGKTLTIQDHTGKLGFVVLADDIDQIAQEMLEGK